MQPPDDAALEQQFVATNTEKDQIADLQRQLKAAELRATQAESMARTLQAQRDAVEADAAMLRLPRTQITNVVDALVGLIDDWNDLAEDDDRGRDNAALCLTLWDDGSGRLGTFHSYDAEYGTFATLTMNIQIGFNTSGELVEDLLQWVEHSEAFATDHPGAALEASLKMTSGEEHP